MKMTSAAVVLALAAGGSAYAAEPGGSQCFRTSEMRNHTVVDDRTLHVGVGINHVARIGMRGNCLAGAHSNDPLVISTTGSSGLVCKPLDLNLGIKRGGANGITSSCIVDSIVMLTPEQVSALPKNLKP